ncbi:MAG: hypothetical protein QXX12_05790 [Nanopusillaceae archaeon]
MKFKLESSYREILILITLLLFFLKFGVISTKERLETKRVTYAELKEAYERKLRITHHREDAEAIEARDSMTFIKRSQIERLYAKEEDPILVQLRLSKKIQSLAENSTLKIESIELLPINQGNYTVEAPLKVKLTGKTKEVLNFLEGLEKFFLFEEKKLCKLREVSLNERNRELNLNLQISVLISKIDTSVR